MKKFLLTTLACALLILPFSSTALADDVEEPSPAGQAQDYVPGSIPAQAEAAEVMSPALHGVVLAMSNHGADTFDPSDTALAWEAVYNMLSLYGQLDSRSQPDGDWLAFPAEVAQDYAAALGLDLSKMGPPPVGLSDRLTYDRANGCYQVVCGSNDLAQLQVRDTTAAPGRLQAEGALVYLVDGSDLMTFQAELRSQDTMFGWVLAGLTLTEA